MSSSIENEAAYASASNRTSNPDSSASTNPGSHSSSSEPASEMAGDHISPMGRRVLIFVLLAWILDAADSTIYSLTLPMIKDEFGLTLGQMGAIGSVFLFGSVFGAFLLPMLAEKKGRRVGMAVCIGIFSVFTGLIGLANSVVMLVVCRFFTGAGAGAEWPIGAAYLSEMVPAKRRGFAMGIMQAGYPIGYFVAGGIFALVGWMEMGWRACYVILLVPGLLCFPVLTWLKESSTWLKNRGQGAALLQRKPLNLRQLFVGKYRRNTVIATGLHVFGAIYSYGLVVWVPSAIMIDFHMTKVQAAQFVMLSWGIGAFGYFASGPLSDRFGRKAILALYTLIGLVGVLYLNYLKTQTGVVLTDLFVPGVLIGISLGVAAIYITYTSEIYPSHLRTVGLGMSVSVGKMTAVLVPVLLGLVAEHSSVSTALLFSTGLGFLMLPIIMAGPETARRHLEDIVQ